MNFYRNKVWIFTDTKINEKNHVFQHIFATHLPRLRDPQFGKRCSKQQLCSIWKANMDKFHAHSCKISRSQLQCISLFYVMFTKQPSGSIKYVTLFWTNFDPLSHFVKHLEAPLKYVTHLGPPIVSGTCIRTYVLVLGGFCPEGFVRVIFFRPRFLSEYIHPLQQKAKHHFQFYVSYVWKVFFKV